jgi:hypothetical protein
MRSITANSTVAKTVGVLALVGHVVAGLLYIILPGLEVPYPALYAFQAAWVIVLALAIWWLRYHPWRSALLVVVGAVLVSVVRVLGEMYLGWRG